MSDTSTSKCSIDLKLLAVKLFFFFCVGAIGDLLPFMALYMKKIGMTRSQAGIIYGLMPFVGFLVRPFFGAIADKFHRHKFLLILCCICTGLSYNLMLLVPSHHVMHTKVKTDIMCSQADSYLRDCYHVNQTLNQCPLSFHSYALKVKSDLDENNVLLNLNDSRNVPYVISTLGSVTQSVTNQEVKCSLMCSYKAPPTTPQKVCFTNQSGTYDTAECFNVNLNLGRYQSHLEVTILDLGYILNKEVVVDRQQVGDLICRDYDLKELVYNGQDYWQMLCSEDISFNCDLQCSHVDTCTEIVPDDLKTSSFWFFFILFLLGNIFIAPTVSLGDAITYDLLGEERQHKWGEQRLWGTIGFALFAVISTISMDTIKSDVTSNNFSIAFYMFSALNLISAIVVFFMTISNNIASHKMLQGTMQLLRTPKTCIFILVIFYFGMLNGVIEAFLYWFLEEDLGNQLKIIPGLCALINCTAETPMLYFSGRIIKKFGHVTCLYAVFVAYFMRLCFYSLLFNPWLVLPIEILHSMTFGLMWASATSYGSLITPPGLSGTIQGILSGVHFGFGKGVGSLITGQLYTQIGMRWTFRLYGILSLVLLLLYIVLNKCVFTKDRHRFQVPVIETEVQSPEKNTDDIILSYKDDSEKLDEFHDEKPAEFHDEPENTENDTTAALVGTS